MAAAGGFVDVEMLANVVMHQSRDSFSAALAAGGGSLGQLPGWRTTEGLGLCMYKGVSEKNSDGGNDI